jgi:hypothetical protein
MADCCGAITLLSCLCLQVPQKSAAAIAAAEVTLIPTLHGPAAVDIHWPSVVAAGVSGAGSRSSRCGPCGV